MAVGPTGIIACIFACLALLAAIVPVRRPRWRPACGAIAIVLAGLAATAITFAYADRGFRDGLGVRCQALAAALDRRDLAELGPDRATVTAPGFVRIKQRLADLRAASPDLTYVYILGHHDGRLYFLDDDSPTTDSDWAPPDEPYAEAPPAMVAAVASGRGFALGPYRDRWGEFITVGVPIPLDDGRTVAAAFDVRAAGWRSHLLLWSIWPLALAACVAWIWLLFASRSRALAAARAATRDARLAERAKDDYLATVSRDLRAPLGSIIGMTSMLADGELGREQRECLEHAGGAARQLLTLCDELLEYARMEAGEIDLERMPFAPRDTLESAISLAGESAMVKGVELTAVVMAAVPESVIGDAQRLHQVVLNLLVHAIGRTEHGAVVARLAFAERDGGSCLVLSVSDSGPPLDEESARRLFQPFSHAAANMSRPGSGLGLCIVKRIVEAQQGSIASGEAAGGGCAITVILPVGLDASPRAPSPLPGVRLGARILVATDRPDLREALGEQLRFLGLVPVVADTAERAAAEAERAAVQAALVQSLWAPEVQPTLSRLKVPVAIIAMPSTGGTQVVATRIIPVLLRPISTSGLVRTLTRLWSPPATASIRRRSGTTASRPPAPPEPAPEADDPYAPTPAAGPPAKPSLPPPDAPATTRIALAASMHVGLRSALDAAKDGISSGDLGAVQRIAWSLRLSAQPLGLHELVERCLALEDAAGRNDVEAAVRLASDLAALRSRVMAALIALESGSG